MKLWSLYQAITCSFLYMFKWFKKIKSFLSIRDKMFVTLQSKIDSTKKQDFSNIETKADEW